MKSSVLSRRGILNGALATTAVAVTTHPSFSAAATSACGGLTREEFLEYLALFNANDPSFIRYYHDDVTLELGSTVIRGPAGIRDFYAPVKAHIHEKVELAHFVSDATGIAAELPTEFRVYKDWENGFFQRPLKAGEVMRTISFVLYEVKGRKFHRIRAARYRQIHDWRMEPA
jgi:hypothetical protein